MKFAKSAFACLAAIFFAAPATAKTVDQYGVVVFTQADVNAGGITPGDTPGFPVSILASGSYRLASPLTLTSLKNGIVIAAPAVTLDLGGFKISGAAVGRSGIVSQQIDTTIRNGIVRGFTEFGIAGTADFLTVERVSVTNNGSDGIADTGFTAFSWSIIDSTVSGNGQAGIYCFASCLVRGSKITKNGGSGVSTGYGGNVLGNVISQNGDYGLLAGPSTGYGDNTITLNTLGPNAGGTPLQPNACTPGCAPPP